MYRKNKNNWVKHLDFMILDLICLQVAFFLAYTLRHRTVNLYTNYIYANLSIVLILIDVCLLIFLNTLKNVLKRGYLVEFIATIKHVAIVELVAVLYLFSVKMREIFRESRSFSWHYSMDCLLMEQDFCGKNIFFARCI